MPATTTLLPHRVAVRMVELAAHAPSTHNTQPWAWRVLPRQLELHADLRRRLPAEDPEDRNLVISCGASLHHLQVAASALGWEPHVQLLPEPHHPTLLARVAFVRWPPPPDAGARLDAIFWRCTDRRRFTTWPVDDERLVELASVATPWGTTALPVVDAVDRFRLERVVRRAAELQAQDRAAVAEQLDWLEHSPHDGLLERRREPDDDLRGSDGVIVLGDVEDDRRAWLRTGQGLSALWLEATRLGLSVVPLSQPVEVPRTREALRREVLGGWLRPHLLLRIGWQAIGRSGVRRTPRRPVADLLLDPEGPVSADGPDGT